MNVFNFVQDDRFRAALEADYLEIRACVSGQAWKSVHVMAGSVIEALLADYLIGVDQQRERDVLNMPFADLVSACKTQKIVSTQTAELCTVVRLYRNLIHPSRGIRTEETVDERTANIAVALVDIVIREISARRLQTCGLTAAQLLAKLEVDPTTSAILEHLVRPMHNSERERILQLIPARYLKIVSELADERTESLLARLAHCYRFVLESATKDIQRRQAERFVSILRESGQSVVETYESRFFRAADLSHLGELESQLVRSHLLSVSESYLKRQMGHALEGLAKRLQEQELQQLWTVCLRLITTADETIESDVREFLQSECLGLPEQTKAGLMAIVQRRVAFHRDNLGATKMKERLDSLLDLLESDIPF